MQVLFAASEATPFIKSGGLGDVVGSLPHALRKHNLDVRVIIPKYSDIPENFKQKLIFKKSITVDVGWRKQFCGIEEYVYEDVPFYFIDNEYYFKRPGLYGYYDEAERFTFFCRAILASLPYLDFKPQIIHTHDWQTALLSLFLKAFYQDDPDYNSIKTIFTIHNLKYQGIFPPEVLGDLLGLGGEYFTEDKLEFYGNINFMKAGLIYSDLITTVSPTYAEEIKDPYFGENLDGFLRKKGDKLFGILNGIDYKKYDPLTDLHIFVNYKSSLKKKNENKLQLQELLNLPVRQDVPVIAVISRLVNQKGFDLVEHVLDEILALDLQLIVLGTGEQKYENLFRDAAQYYPQKVSANITFDETLAHKIYAGADMFLMPSLFEPCGLSQMIALRYGTIPIVREIGGLKDTVQSYDEFTGEGNGFSFTNYNAHDMLFTINRAVNFYQDQETWTKIVKNAVKSKFSWKKSAQEYIDLYNRLIPGQE